MNITDRQVLVLLRTALWKTSVDTTLFKEGADWSAIFLLAKQQTVVGLIYDAILTLPEHLRPDTSILHFMHLQTIRIAQSNLLLNDRLVTIISRLQNERIRPVLLKGQGVAQNYPNPIRRSCGDIDLYIGEPHYTRCCELTNSWEMTDEKTTESIQHMHLQWNGVTIELHRIAGVMYTSKNRAFRQWSDTLLQGDSCRMMEIEGTMVLLPPVRFDSLFIFYHTYKHFLTGGIGLRQLCDWVMYLHTFNKEIDHTTLMNDLNTFGLLRPWQVMGHIAVSHLGLTVEEFPFYDAQNKYRTVADSMVNRILQNGNFGCYNPSLTKRPKGYLAGKTHNFRAIHLYLKQVFKLYPHDTWCYYKTYLVNGVTRILKDIFYTK